MGFAFDKYILQKIKLYKSRHLRNLFRMFFLKEIDVSSSKIGYFFYLIKICSKLKREGFSELIRGGCYFFN